MSRRDEAATVRVGEVVPPEGGDDWRRPLTWVAAAGMLATPATALAWFVIWPPVVGGPQPGTWLLAAVLPLGAALTGSTQRGGGRALAATLGGGLFGALATVIVGADSSSLAQGQAVAGAAAGGVGVLVAAGQAALLAKLRSRARRALVPGLIGATAAALVVPLLAPILG